MSFEAKYDGRCVACDDRIHVGDLVKYDDDELIHVRCEIPSLPNPRDELTTVCRQCWLVHAGDCE